MYSSSTRTEPQVPKSPISSVSSSGVSEIGATDDGGNTWIDISENANCSTTDASITAGKNAKELIDTIRFHAQELFGNHQALEKVVVVRLVGLCSDWYHNGMSILTVGGVGGVATAFAARDILGNMLSGLSLQFSKPFSVGDYIKVIMNKSRAMWHVSVAKLPVRTGDIEKIPAVTEEIKAELMSNPKIDAPYCYLSQLGSSQGELTVGCNIRGTKREEWSSTEQDILLKAAGVLKKHQLWSTV
ncbi:hypothetical protein PR202_gb09371 [Eleusine coracana subsp. coracana]|uniref:Mechanosensitive ion channel MscS domain-containing protein n=1 Tax=Eleusine coracana subsp. coracana TaxID=191504 RepID=A0AAV5EGZ5_ELECO|nr:hypothetical protein PR202_gb09371 [Eleusine coracana subsp. coracana]